MYQCTVKLGDQRAGKCLQVHFKKLWNIQVQTVMSRVNYESDPMKCNKLRAIVCVGNS